MRLWQFLTIYRQLAALSGSKAQSPYSFYTSVPLNLQTKYIGGPNRTILSTMSRQLISSVMVNRLANTRVREVICRILQPAEGDHLEGSQCSGEAGQGSTHRSWRRIIQC